MNPESQAIFDEILKKSPSVLNADERAFLRARRSYLKESQAEEYREVLDEQEAVVTVKPDQTSYRDLQRKAKEKGLRYVGVSREDLVLQLHTIEGPASEVK